MTKPKRTSKFIERDYCFTCGSAEHIEKDCPLNRKLVPTSKTGERKPKQQPGAKRKIDPMSGVDLNPRPSRPKR